MLHSLTVLSKEKERMEKKKLYICADFHLFEKAFTIMNIKFNLRSPDPLDLILDLFRPPFAPMRFHALPTRQRLGLMTVG